MCPVAVRPLYRPNILSFFHFFLFLILNILKLSLMDSTKQDFFLCFISFKYLPLLLLYTYTLLIIHFLVIIIIFFISLRGFLTSLKLLLFVHYVDFYAVFHV